MLVLSRKPGDKVCLGNDIVLTVLEVNGHRVRLGIEAPAAIHIRRLELVPLTAMASLAHEAAPCAPLIT